MKQDIAEFEEQLRKLWNFWQPKLTHGEMVGTWEIVRLDYQLGRLTDNAKTEQYETPVIKGEQATAPAKVTIENKPDYRGASPLPAEVTK